MNKKEKEPQKKITALICQHPKAYPTSNTDVRQMLNYKLMNNFDLQVEFLYLDSFFSLFEQFTKFQLSRIRNKIGIFNLKNNKLNKFFGTTYIPVSTLKRIKPDIILAYGICPVFDRKKIQVPIFYTGGLMTDSHIRNKYGSEDIALYREFQINSERWKTEYVDIYHSHTLVSKDLCKLHFPENEKKFITIPFFLPQINSISDNLFQQKWNKKRKKAIFVGNQAKLKNLEGLLDAWEKINKIESLSIDLTIISDFRDGKINIPADKNIRVLSSISNKEVLNEMMDSHFFLFPSTKDSYGLVLIEAMASGCAILGFDNEVQAEIIKMNSAGLLFNSKEKDGLYSTLLKLIESENSKSSAINGLKAFKEKYSPEVVSNQFFRVWESAISSAK